MLYEPPKTKKYILIGTGAVFLAVLVVIVAPLIFKGRTKQNPAVNLPLTAEQERIQKEFEKLEAMRKDEKIPTPEEIQKEFEELEKQRAEANTTEPTPEQIQAEFEKLEQMRR